MAGKLSRKRNNCFRFTPTILYSWFVFLNEVNHCSSCFSSLSKSYIAVQGTTSDKSMKEGLRSFYVVDRRTPMATPTKKAMDAFFVTLRESGKRL